MPSAAIRPKGYPAKDRAPLESEQCQALGNVWWYSARVFEAILQKQILKGESDYEKRKGKRIVRYRLCAIFNGAGSDPYC